MKIRWRLFADENEPVTRMRGIQVYHELQQRGVDADALAPDENADIIVCQYDAWDLPKLRGRCQYLVMDVCDAHFMPHHPNKEFFVPNVSRYADWVTTSSGCLKYNMDALFDPNCVTYIPEPLEERYENVARRPNNDGTILWTGMHDNASYFTAIDPVFETLHAEGEKFEVVFVHSDRNSRGVCEGSNKKLVGSKAYPTRHVTWSLQSIVEWMSKADIAICPVLQNGWCRCKSANKAASFAAAGIPVVATDIPSYRELITHGENGYLCWSPDDWYEPIKLLLSDAEHRAEAGERVRTSARALYSIERICDLFMGVVEKMVV